jgi:hypothetical protein
MFSGLPPKADLRYHLRGRALDICVIERVPFGDPLAFDQGQCSRR